MKPQKQPIQINFSGGVDTKTDPKQVILSKFLSLKNSIFDELGLMKKRNGYEELGTDIISQFSYTFQAFSSAVQSGVFTSKFQSELVMGDGYNFYSYSDPDDSWVYKGRLENAATSLESIHQDQYNNVTADCAVNLTTGFSLYAWESWQGGSSGTQDPRINSTPRGVAYSLRDDSTKLEILSAPLSSTTSRPRCVSIGSSLYIIFYDSSVTSLKAFSVSSAGAGVAVTVANNIDTTNPNYDVFVNNSLIYVAYNGTSSTTKVASFNSSFTSVASTSKSEIASNGIGIFSDASNNVWVAYNNSTETKAFIMNSALTVTVLAPTVVDSGSTAANVQNVTGVYDGTRAIIFYDQPGLPVLGQDIGAEIDAMGFTQPAVGSAEVVPFTGPALSLKRQLVYIAGGGYYYINSGGSGLISLVNLGYRGNASPGASVAGPATIYPAYGYSDAVVNYNTLTAAGTAGTATVYMKSVALNSRAFVKDSIAHVVVAYDSQIQPTFFLTSLFNISSLSPIQIGNVTAKIIPSEGSGIPRTSILPNVSLDQNSTYRIALSKHSFTIERSVEDAEILLYYNGVVSSGINLDPVQVSSQEIGNSLNIAGGAINAYDGQSVTELGFHIYPENVTGVVTPASGLLGDGLYGYQVVYQWIDAQGQIHRSAPSPVLSIDTGAADASITLTIPYLRVTAKSNVTIAIYRTVVNGSVYFRLDTQANAFPITNNVQANSFTFTDPVQDEEITGNERLYTEGEVENIAPPASTILGVCNNRLTLVPSENPYSRWFSKQVIPGTPVEMSDLLVQNVGTVGGPLTGIGNLDDKNILFKGTSIYYVLGQGPAPSGANNDFTDPIFITADCGLVDVESIVVMPHGLMFKSKKGIYLLNRKLIAEYIGNDVESFNSSSVVSADLIPKSNQVRFLLDSGAILMYDYFVGQWAIWDELQGVSSIIHNDLQVFIDSSGVAHRETPGVYLDGAVPVLQSFVTAWIKLAGLQGYQRAFFFYILAEYLSPHQLSLAISYNFSSSSSQTTVISPTTNSLENWRVFLAKQRCQSFQIALNEIYTGTPGAGFTMSGLNLIVGMKSGFRTIAADQSAG